MPRSFAFSKQPSVFKYVHEPTVHHDISVVCAIVFPHQEGFQLVRMGANEGALCGTYITSDRQTRFKGTYDRHLERLTMQVFRIIENEREIPLSSVEILLPVGEHVRLKFLTPTTEAMDWIEVICLRTR